MIYTVEFWIPFPPSTNRLWRNIRGRTILAPEYKDWKKRATDALLIEQGLGNSPVLGTHQVNVYLSDRFAARRDADNRLKAILDIAGKCRLVVDDKLCRKASIEWAEIEHDCLVNLSGEIAYMDQWEFAKVQAENAYQSSAGRRKTRRARQ